MDDHPSGAREGPVDRIPPIGRLTRRDCHFTVYNDLNRTFVLPISTESDQNIPLLAKHPGCRRGQLFMNAWLYRWSGAVKEPGGWSLRGSERPSLIRISQGLLRAPASVL